MNVTERNRLSASTPPTPPISWLCSPSTLRALSEAGMETTSRQLRYQRGCLRRASCAKVHCECRGCRRGGRRRFSELASVGDPLVDQDHAGGVRCRGGRAARWCRGWSRAFRRRPGRASRHHGPAELPRQFTPHGVDVLSRRSRRSGRRGLKSLPMTTARATSVGYAVDADGVGELCVYAGGGRRRRGGRPRGGRRPAVLWVLPPPKVVMRSTTGSPPTTVEASHLARKRQLGARVRYVRRKNSTGLPYSAVPGSI